MIRLISLDIKGIRSFDPHKSNRIEFDVPLTLIVGQNGTGKTTIIECLKYLTTGELPPNSKQGVFVFDAKLINELDVKSELVLQFSNNTDIYQVNRILHSTYKLKKIEQKQIECSFNQYKNGNKLLLSNKISDVDKLVPIYLDSFPSILENIIFCHQEEMAWPVGDPVILKRKIDEIFGNTKYNKTLQQLKITKKELEQSVKLKTHDLAYLYKNKSTKSNIEKIIDNLKHEITKKMCKIDEILIEKQNLCKEIKYKSDINEKLNQYEKDYYFLLKENDKLKSSISEIQSQHDFHNLLSLDCDILKQKIEVNSKNLSNVQNCKQNINYIEIESKYNNLKLQFDNINQLKTKEIETLKLLDQKEYELQQIQCQLQNLIEFFKLHIQLEDNINLQLLTKLIENTINNKKKNINDKSNELNKIKNKFNTIQIYETNFLNAQNYLNSTKDCVINVYININENHHIVLERINANIKILEEELDFTEITYQELYNQYEKYCEKNRKIIFLEEQLKSITNISQEELNSMQTELNNEKENYLKIEREENEKQLMLLMFKNRKNELENEFNHLIQTTTLNNHIGEQIEKTINVNQNELLIEKEKLKFKIDILENIINIVDLNINNHTACIICKSQIKNIHDYREQVYHLFNINELEALKDKLNKLEMILPNDNYKTINETIDKLNSISKNYSQILDDEIYYNNNCCLKSCNFNNIKIKIQEKTFQFELYKKKFDEYNNLQNELNILYNNTNSNIIKELNDSKIKIIQLKLQLNVLNNKKQIIQNIINTITNEINNRKTNDLIKEAKEIVSKYSIDELDQIKTIMRNTEIELDELYNQFYNFQTEINYKFNEYKQILIKKSEITNTISTIKSNLKNINVTFFENISNKFKIQQEEFNTVKNKIAQLNEQECYLIKKEIILKAALKVYNIQNCIKLNEEKIKKYDIEYHMNVKHEIQLLQEKLNKIEKFENLCKGEIKQLDINKTARESELKAYSDALKQYNEAAIELKLLELSIEDINKSVMALEKTVLEYHSNKIEEINDILKELWSETYNGKDIERIELKSDLTSTNYNYKLIMYKLNNNNISELEMRGRCSAGQKMIASILFRIALMEVFSNINVLALDEPTTNLDKANIECLAKTLNNLLLRKKNMQLIIITHDEEFVSMLNTIGCDVYYTIERDKLGRSHILRNTIH